MDSASGYIEHSLVIVPGLLNFLAPPLNAACHRMAFWECLSYWWRPLFLHGPFFVLATECLLPSPGFRLFVPYRRFIGGIHHPNSGCLHTSVWVACRHTSYSPWATGCPGPPRWSRDGQDSSTTQPGLDYTVSRNLQGISSPSGTKDRRGSAPCSRCDRGY